MDHLKLADLTRSAIEERRKEVQRCETEIVDVEQRMSSLQEELAALHERKALLEKDVLWRTLMAEAESVEEGRDNSTQSIRQNVAERVELAVSEFKRSLQEPAEYRAECSADSNGEPVPYCDTDDYADLTALDNVVDELVDEVNQSLVEHAAPHLTTASSHNSSIASSIASRDAMSTAAATPASEPKGNVEKQKDVEDASARRRALLKLLIVSLYAGRIEELCGFAEMPDPSSVPSSDADDIKDEVAGTWQRVLYESHVLTPAEKTEWRRIVAAFLGQPFSSPP